MFKKSCPNKHTVKWLGGTLFVAALFVAGGARAQTEGAAEGKTAELAAEPEPEGDAFPLEQPSEPVTPSTPTPRDTPPYVAHPPAESPGATAPAGAAPTSEPVTVQRFHSALSPHGTWYDTTEHGWVWKPNVWAGWRPYTYGRWLYTSYGWTWRSYHKWGWAPFHYGRWFVHGQLGWVWVPGTEWAPAWVSWRYNDGYMGWAPVPPGYTQYTSTSIYPTLDASHWIFVPGVHITNVRVYRHVIVHTSPVYRTVYASTRYSPVYVRAGRVSHAGPRPTVVARAIGRVVRPIPVVVASRAGESRPGAMMVYRPPVRAVAGGARPVVGFRGAQFSGGRPGAIVAPLTRPMPGLTATRLTGRWRPVAVQAAPIIRASQPAVRVQSTIVAPGRLTPPLRRTVVPGNTVPRISTGTRPLFSPVSPIVRPTPVIAPRPLAGAPRIYSGTTATQGNTPRPARPLYAPPAGARVRPAVSPTVVPYRPKVFVPTPSSKSTKKPR